MKYKTERQWYSSPEHLRTEKSWEEYKRNAKNRKPVKRRIQFSSRRNPFRF